MDTIYQPVPAYNSLHALVKWYNNTPPEMHWDDDFSETVNCKILAGLPPLPTTHYVGKVTARRHHVEVSMCSDTEGLSDNVIRIYPATN